MNSLPPGNMAAMDAWATGARWAALAAATALVSWLVALAGLPSSALFGALLVGVGAALLAPDRLRVPAPLFIAAQAGAGVVLGTFLDRDSLDALGASWLPLALVTAATLGISLGAGILLARLTSLDLPSAALGMVAGGASGIVGISDELGADDRLVAFMQYLRVLVIVALTPFLAALVFPGADTGAAAAAAPAFGDLRGWLITVAVATAGGALGHRARIPGGALLVPMAGAAVLTLAVPGGAFTVPPAISEVAFALIGLQVGLKFTVGTIRLLGRLLAPVLLAVFGVLIACALLGAVLALTTSVSMRDAYLATTPGGLYAVLAVAVGSNADAGFILAAQGLRLIVMIALAPVFVRWVVRRWGARTPARAP
jgi:membrane AbrB-like protein